MNIGDFLSGRIKKSGQITRFWLAYFGALILFVWTANHVPDMGVIFYFVCGFVLNRYILSKVRWHTMQSTLSKVAMAKLSAFLLWPVVYPALLIQMFIARYL